MYFTSKGKPWTADTARLAVERARALSISNIVVASNTGFSAEAILMQLKPEDAISVSVVTHHIGFDNPGEDQMPAAMRERLAKAGCKVLTTTHLFANIERAITSKFGGLYPGGIVSATLRCFGQGTKVCFEIIGMAVDAGMVPPGQEVVVVAGSGGGADTALVMRPAHAKSFFDTQVLEVICKPRDF